MYQPSSVLGQTILADYDYLIPYLLGNVRADPMVRS